MKTAPTAGSHGVDLEVMKSWGAPVPLLKLRQPVQVGKQNPNPISLTKEQLLVAIVVARWGEEQNLL